MNRVITSFKKANKDLLKYIMEEFPDGVEEETLVSFPKAGGGSIRALEIEMGDTIYLVKMEDEEYYQKYMAKDDDDEYDETATVDVEEDIEEVEVDEEIENEDDTDDTDENDEPSDNEDDEDED